MQEEEIELIDIFRILWKRRKLILLGTLLLTIGAAGISLLLPKVYEVSTIEPARIGSDRVIEAEAIKSILESYDDVIRRN
jgi:LPS O-antigen subunit length determinant protein (WzzB/FepE family)